jgi:hypothetical protein
MLGWQVGRMVGRWGVIVVIMNPNSGLEGRGGGLQ